MRINKKGLFRRSILIAMVIIGTVSLIGWMRRPIRIGIMYSQSGTMALSEQSLQEAALLAVDEINAAGGVLDRRIEPIMVDGQSDPGIFAFLAESLITRDKVRTIFGCWTSSSRKAVEPIMERYDHLLFYSLQYEGLEESPNIVYLGASPNQQILPALEWALTTQGKRIFLVGSDYVFPHAAHAIIREQAKQWRGKIVGEEYLPLGSFQVKEIIDKIKDVQPDVIFNTINGSSNEAFFQQLHEAGVTPDQIPIISFSISETELQRLSIEHLKGHYTAWSYFQSLDLISNKEFIQKFRKKYGQDRVISNPIINAYLAVYLWAQAVENSGTPHPAGVREAIKGLNIKAPGGMVHVDADNQHLWQKAYIGQIRDDGQFDIIWDSRVPIRPQPYPLLQSQEYWDDFLSNLYQQWGGDWENRHPIEK